ncbi:electron transport complex protein RnfD [Thermoclostridium stercorarium subsp. stercorarium DSM 8532]|uniref:Ion-translocating oxidoreductase complex subunit D n=3 Tax=Thermoclostridium stercorarium TaxID=1510 RepID=L7VUX8_THES1|nr:RnfABCDGE type electron transport complex subunit D [Thermoclostridium stercorarium]AGC69388.1 electron transport complex protein RnfD [Thermoclostridium stercorarium subsp. stercorarium DSM 8532]AGI40347.1 NfoD [Thermoclostridium stercorarium subsp. stercorarium DSM 8532]ANX00065.1 NADH:ubiquinone oxidoreductase [Thermoclostridium stercorarium subsp. thermolacticum DSM 2910]ANX02709.1 NADH:ubiquinone oxidoreductase [Thermoclostridium stercorarium subsp. leptospartum DSM 9219]UZQ85345.1 Rnf
MENRLFVCSSPHLRDNVTTQRLMLDVIIALIPSTVAGILFFGLRAALVIAVTVSASVLTEYLMRKGLKREQTISDLSAVVTGLLLALNLPPSIPLWIAVVGAVIATGLIKQLFGGLGQNFMNPALGARVILVVAWAKHMTTWTEPFVDAVASATPLSLLDATTTATPVEGSVWYSYLDMFLGRVPGCIGETSALAILLGFVYLLIRRVITWHIPVIYTGTVALLTWILGTDGLFTGDPLYHVLAGGLLLGAVFMATDYVTCPVTRKGQIIYALGCGILTVLFRLYGNMPEGVSFAIILMNIVTPLIDRHTIPVAFGGEKRVG